MCCTVVLPGVCYQASGHQDHIHGEININGDGLIDVSLVMSRARRSVHISQCVLLTMAFVCLLYFAGLTDLDCGQQRTPLCTSACGMTNLGIFATLR